MLSKHSSSGTKDSPEYIFYDGPPFATGLPHYGHILAATIKDIVTRYQSTTDHHVTRRFGWDCHGLPLEYEIDQKLGIKSREDVIKLGISNYNGECSGDCAEARERVGEDRCQKGLVYKSFKVMPYSTECKTPLSNFEATDNYREVSYPEIMVSFSCD